MPKSKMQMLRKLVHVGPRRAEELDDDLLMVGKSEVPVSPLDQPPVQLVQSINSRQRKPFPPSSARQNHQNHQNLHHHQHQHKQRNHSPPMSVGIGNADSPPRTPPPSQQSFRSADSLSLKGYRRSPAPEPIMEVDEVGEAPPLDRTAGVAEATHASCSTGSSKSSAPRQLPDSSAESVSAVEPKTQTPITKDSEPIGATARRLGMGKKSTVGRRAAAAYVPDNVVGMQARAQMYTCIS